MLARRTGLLAALSVAVAAAAADVPVTFRVRVPPGTPAAAEIRISGGLPALGSWDGRGILLAPDADGAYVGTIRAEPGTFLEFKVTRGGWDTVEKAVDGAEIRNRSLVVAAADTVDVAVAAWRDQVGDKPRTSTVTGTVRTHADFASRHLALPRDVRVWLPPGYDDEPERRYPVLYMHDGQNVFDAATSFVGLEWEADETATRLLAAGGMEPILIVAVSNTAERTTEYGTPETGGRGDAYGRFLLEELKPYVDRHYRTRPDVAGLAGSSLGGLVTIYLGLEHPQVFRRLGVLSPAVFFRDRTGDVVKRVARAHALPERIWVDVGTREGVTPDDHRMWLDGARALRDALLARGLVPGRDLEYLEDEGAVHDEAAWAGRLDRVLRFLFPARAPAVPPGPAAETETR